MKIRFHIVKAALVIIALYPAICLADGEATGIILRGVNLSGGEFSAQKLPGIFHKDYIYPTAADIAMFAKEGMNTIRVPVLWERIQPKLNEALDAQEMQRIDQVFAAAHEYHVRVIIDPHNYGKYKDKYIGSDEVPVTSFVNLWERLALHYVNEPDVIFGLMNEPHKQSAELWADIAQQTINAIRKSGGRQLILVPGTKWTGAHSWEKKAGKLSNAQAFEGITDPAKNMLIEVHQYFDADYSGKSPVCVSADIGEKALAGITQWLRKTRHKAFLAEFGASKDPVCLEALANTLSYMQHNADVWEGWTYWAAGSWLGKYPFNIQPPMPDIHPQISVLKQQVF